MAWLSIGAPSVAEQKAHLPGREAKRDNCKQASIGKETTWPGQVQRPVRRLGRYQSLGRTPTRRAGQVDANQPAPTPVALPRSARRTPAIPIGPSRVAHPDHPDLAHGTPDPPTPPVRGAGSRTPNCRLGAAGKL